MNDVESDGRRIEPHKDPPGQKCVYIVPGDPTRETYRLATFRNYPQSSPIDPRELASNGFYYVGYRDRVKCFSCGQASENWSASDEVADACWHHRECRFYNGTDQSNIPIGTLFPNTSLQQSYIRRPIHNRTSPLFRNTLNNNVKSSGITMQKLTAASATPRVDENNQTTTSFHCLYPINPHMRSREARIQTFLDHSSNWPAHRIRATPHDIVDAGMFYLGERDRVKCWYCNGGLQNWERDDQPWEEHAKWFPLCEFVLQQKGVQYVDRIVSKYSNLRRPALHNPSIEEAASGIARRLNIVTNALVSVSSTSNTPVSSILIDPREDLRKRDKKIEEQMKSSLVETALSMGFEASLVQKALKRKFQQTNEMFSCLQDLIESLLSLESEVNEEGNEIEPHPACSTNNHNGTSLANQMLQLEEAKKCKVCRKEDSCMVLIPCGHLVCCVVCGGKIKKCPACKEIVREKVRSYIS